MAVYIVTLSASITVLKTFELAQGLKIFITLLPAIPVAFVLISMMRVIRDSDELQQRVHLLATSFSALLTGFVTFTYGFLENIGFPKFSTFLVLPMLFFFWGISLSWFTKRYQ
jgi:hypothetical protein